MAESNNKENRDALNAMKDDLAQPSSSTTDQLSSDPADMPINQEKPHLQISIKQQLKVFEEINNQMGLFCQALKVVDKQFDQQAQTFFRTAAQLAEKEKLNDEENIELTVNLAAWATVKVVGKIYANLQKSKQLGEVKKILSQEADSRLDTVKGIRKNMPLILDTAYYRYTSETDLNQALICLSNLRESEYMDQVSLFLEATYEAALEGKFQDSYPYPSFAPINRNILYGLLCGKPELAKNEFWEGRRECIESLISKTETVINENGMPSKELYVFASDSQVMAIAVHDIYPMAENDDVEFTDDNQERLKSQEYYEKFLQLYKAALSNRENIEAKAILNNEMLAETVNHYLEIDIAIADSQSRLGTQVCIIGLIALLGFLSTWLLNAWPWYWSVLIGVVAAVITFIIMPISRVFEDRNDKLIRIEKSIQNDSLNRGGEVKMIDLASLEKNTTRPWKGALIGALLGLFIPPFFLMGALAWGAVGFILVLIFGGEKDQEDVDYSYGHIKVGPSLKMRIFMYFLIACCIGVVVYYFINKNTEKKRVLNEDVVEAVDSNDEFEVVEEISEPITETVSIESSEETDEQLIRTIYDKFVFGFSDENPNSYFTPKAIKSLQDAYDYDCPDNDCYGYWELRTGTQDGPSNECGITSIESQGNGWFIVSYKDMGLSGKTRIKVVDHKIDDYESSGVL